MATCIRRCSTPPVLTYMLSPVSLAMHYRVDNPYGTLISGGAYDYAGIYDFLGKSAFVGGDVTRHRICANFAVPDLTAVRPIDATLEDIALNNWSDDLEAWVPKCYASAGDDFLGATSNPAYYCSDGIYALGGFAGAVTQSFAVPIATLLLRNLQNITLIVGEDKELIDSGAGGGTRGDANAHWNRFTGPVSPVLKIRYML